MPSFRFIGTEERVWPGDGTRPTLVAAPGDQIDADENPDPMFFELVGGAGQGFPAAVVPEPAVPDVKTEE